MKKQFVLQRASSAHLVSLGATLIEFIRRIFDCQRCHGQRTSGQRTEWSTSRHRTESQRQWSSRGAGFVITQNMAAHGNCSLLVTTALSGWRGQWMDGEPLRGRSYAFGQEPPKAVAVVEPEPESLNQKQKQIP
uniref:HDC08751 n=1 Tax=Drosophila melanogaster TaxID=7227 RepID=Q6ILQ8_DROME|nr:TPA_inf: HDC08751 [Drosophila melanogaster]